MARNLILPEGWKRGDPVPDMLAVLSLAVGRHRTQATDVRPTGPKPTRNAAEARESLSKAGVW